MGEHRLPKPPRPPEHPADGIAADIVPMMFPKPHVFVVRRAAYREDGVRRLVMQPDGTEFEIPTEGVVVFEGDQIESSLMDIVFVLRGVHIQQSSLVRDISGRPKVEATPVKVGELGRIGVDEFQRRLTMVKGQQLE